MRAATGYADPWSLRDLGSAYSVDKQIGEGVYGKVMRAREGATGRTMALKKVKTDLTAEREGFPITALREIQILKQLAHENIVALNEVALGTEDKSVYLAFEYLDHDLSGLIEASGAGMTEDHVRCYARQLTRGVAHMHSLEILHRDIKASNLLISNRGHLKIGDWGLARGKADGDGKQHYTNRVITLWYRPPELLLGATKEEDGYLPSIDVWSIGCILAELLYQRPILPGNTEIEQLSLIFELCGTPTVEDWPGVANLPLWETFGPQGGDGSDDDDDSSVKPRVLRERFAAFEKSALDLVDEILVHNPEKRVTARAALDRPYLRGAKAPGELRPLNVESAHEWEVRKQRKEGKAAAASKPSR
mmetsp:Transcript_21216/g.63319  ORF Transcript_21216/g.63319 Transcript_21216/m.63319 type:complete len:363 (-) Transcript_21216:41-1129(-)